MEKSAHIIPLRVYLGIGGTLLFLTVLTVLVAQVNLGVMNIIIALGIATLKATLVALFFMHLYYDNKFYGLILGVALFFLTSLIALTMADTTRRGDLYDFIRAPITKEAKMYSDQPKAPAHHEEK